MTEDVIAPGCILHWDGFTLSDGTQGHKFFVIVGAQSNKNFLAVIATSKKKEAVQHSPVAMSRAVGIIFQEEEKTFSKLILGSFFTNHRNCQDRNCLL